MISVVERLQRDFQDRLPETDDPDACLEWQGARRAGYGCIMGMYAHRVAYELHTGEAVPDELQVCHKCDNPLCVNHRHLFLGSAGDNAGDAISKGRRPSGRQDVGSRAKETTQNVRISIAEKEVWKSFAPHGNVSNWLRNLAQKEIERIVSEQAK